MPPKRRRHRVDEPQSPRRVTVRLTPEAVRRLGIACAMEETTPRELIEALILERSRRWVVQDRGRESGQAETLG